MIKIKDFDEKCMIIKIKGTNPSVYERVRGCWRISIDSANQADYVLAVVKGEVVGVYKPTQWFLSCNTDICQKNKCVPGRYPCKRIGFSGKEADTSIQKKYLHKFLPDWYMRPGPGPVLYTYK